ncbi:hypothetical protein KKA53_00320 [Candidatus Dependentiae bacterium]|nr:hypothetical protein [Candidatus Dependentiae bacterium]
MQNSWLVVLPPLFVLFLSFVTHRITLSLFLGIISATLLYHDFSILPALKTTGTQIFEKTEVANLLSWEAFTGSSNLFIYIFLLILGVIITIITATGASQAYGKFVQKRLCDRRGAETSSLLLSLFFFIDDYLNVLTVGSVMPAVTDRFKIPRVKLAYFINAFAGALCILVPFSSWAAYILMQLDASGILPTATSETFIISSSLNLFVQAIPFAFYSFIVVATTFFIVRRNISFGPMRTQEKIAQETGNLFGGKPKRGKPDEIHQAATTCTMIDFLLPILLLIITVILGLFLTNFRSGPALCVGAATTLALIIPYFLIRKKLQVSQLRPVLWDGVNLMLSSILLITLAWTFADILADNLGTGQFLAHKLGNSVSFSFFPLLFFVGTAGITFGIGSAWGAMTVVIPIAIPMLTTMHPATPPIPLEAITIAIPTISAILAGSVVGNILTPIADIVIIGSTSTQAYHMDHIKTQQAYIAPIFLASCISFLLSGMLIDLPTYANALLSLSAGVFTSFSLVTLLNYISTR